MFVRTLELHWKALRWPLALLAVLAFALPLISTARLVTAVEAFRDAGARVEPMWSAGQLGGEWRELYPILAAATGFLVALGVWYRDHRQEHVYALSLPISRPRYVLLKMAAGATLLVPVATAFFVGALVLAAGLDLPEWIHAYPGRLALQFLLAMLLMYALMFAFAAGTVPTALKTLTAVTILLVLVLVLPALYGGSPSGLVDRAWSLAARLLTGPFRVFSVSWSLVGV